MVRDCNCKLQISIRGPQQCEKSHNLEIEVKAPTKITGRIARCLFHRMCISSPKSSMYITHRMISYLFASFGHKYCWSQRTAPSSKMLRSYLLTSSALMSSRVARSCLASPETARRTATTAKRLKRWEIMVADWSGLVNEAWIDAIMKVDCRRVLPVLAKNAFKS